MNPTDCQKATPFFKFENLRLYHKSLTFSIAILAVYDRTSSESDKHVVKRLLDTAMMITNHIIEGSSATKNAFITCLQQAKGCIKECVAYTALLHNRKVIDEEQTDDIRNELIELTKMAGALIVSLQGETN